MLYIFFSLTIFVLTIVLHITLANLFPRYLDKSRNTLITYIFGLFINISLILYLWQLFRLYDSNNLWFLPLPGVAIFLYVLLSLAYLIFFLSPFMGEVSPTSTIVLLLKSANQLSKKKIASYFTDYNLVDKRLEKMIVLGWIIKSRDTYLSTYKGGMIAKIIKFYRKLLGWNSFG